MVVGASLVAYQAYHYLDGLLAGVDIMDRSIEDAQKAKDGNIDDLIEACERRVDNFREATNDSFIPMIENTPHSILNGPASMKVPPMSPTHAFPIEEVING